VRRRPEEGGIHTAEEDGGDGNAKGEREEHNHHEPGRPGQVSESVAEVLVKDVQGR